MCLGTGSEINPKRGRLRESVAVSVRGILMKKKGVPEEEFMNLSEGIHPKSAVRPL